MCLNLHYANKAINQTKTCIHTKRCSRLKPSRTGQVTVVFIVACTILRPSQGQIIIEQAVDCFLPTSFLTSSWELQVRPRSYCDWTSTTPVCNKQYPLLQFKSCKDSKQVVAHQSVYLQDLAKASQPCMPENAGENANSQELQPWCLQTPAPKEDHSISISTDSTQWVPRNIALLQ